jgi:circadian clock protein KaiB
VKVVAVRLRIYVAGDSPNSSVALGNLQAALARHPELKVDLEVIDVLSDPDRAMADGVFVTPTLVKLEPAPERRITGRLHEDALVCEVLGVSSDGPDTQSMT